MTRDDVIRLAREARIPFKWNMSENHPRPTAPGKLTFFHDHVQNQFCITWEPEES